MGLALLGAAVSLSAIRGAHAVGPAGCILGPLGGSSVGGQGGSSCAYVITNNTGYAGVAGAAGGSLSFTHAAGTLNMAGTMCIFTGATTTNNVPVSAGPFNSGVPPMFPIPTANQCVQVTASNIVTAAVGNPNG